MKFKVLSVILIFAVLLSACSLLPSKTDFELAGGEAAFHFIDVGQGDCTLIQTEDAAILIDTGTTEKSYDVVTYIKNLGIKKIDCLIISHPHEDHIGGAADVLSNFAVGTVYVNNNISDSYAYEKFIDKATELDISLKLPDMDCVYEYGNLRIKFLSPKKDYEDENHNSNVTQVSYGDTKFLFTGDAETPVESDLLNEYDLKADVLKVGHHGSRYASHYEFLASVLPSVCVISCGKDNSYGHPHEETVDRIEKIGSTILRTDEVGTICIKTDGKKIYTDEGKTYDSPTEQVALTYIGNKRSKVFHTEMCSGLPQEQNRVFFKNKDEALDAGFRACKSCNP